MARKKRQNPVWRAVRVTRLKLLFAAGHSYTAIAKKMGEGMTRNSVAGACDRLGLKRTIKGVPRSEVRAR